MIPSGEIISTHRQRVIRQLTKMIVLNTFLPLGVLTYWYTRSWFWVALSPLIMPAICMLQSIYGLLAFRVFTGMPPAPQTPRHGVVVVDPNDAPRTSTRSSAASAFKDEHDASNSSSSTPRNAAMPASSSTQDAPDQELYDLPFQSLVHDSTQQPFLQEQQKERPIRVLMVGDSLAIGVGQTKWPSPIMPEAIARTFSKRLGGRPVYWTCHGATGASIGWVIRELQRGVDYIAEDQAQKHQTLSKDQRTQSTCSDAESDDLSGGFSSEDYDEEPQILAAGTSSSFPEQADATSPRNASSTNNPHPHENANAYNNSGIVGGAYEDDPVLAEYEMRLQQHKRRFEPQLRGFYDVVVVVTGPNDMKAALLPFLLTGEDGELRKQAQQRGGSFGQDLQLLLEMIGNKMQVRLQRLQQQMRDTAESMQHAVEHSVELTTGCHFKHSSDNPQTPQEKPHYAKFDHHHQHHVQSKHGHPLVAFVGMPNHLEPVFQTLPSCFYGGPPIACYAPTAIDLLCASKRDICESFPEDLVFVPPPTRELATKYMRKYGPYYEARKDEKVLLSLRDFRSPHESEAVEATMREYYGPRGWSVYWDSPFRKIREWLGVPIPEYLKGWSIDGIHANDVGYDCWGRYLGDYIFEEWKAREERHPMHMSGDKKRN